MGHAMSAQVDGGPPDRGSPPPIALAGSGRQRGRIHGESLRETIHEAVDRWRRELANELGSPVDEYLTALVGETSFERAISRWTPDLLDEVEGIAEGAGIDRATMVAFQLVDEDWWFRRNRRLGIRPPASLKCSALAFGGRGQDAPVVAENLDIPKWSDGLQTLLRVQRPSGDEALVFSYAGMIGLTGVNSSGVGVCVNSLIQLDTRTDGLPVAFVLRGILECSSLEEAARFVRDVDHASGQSYLIGGPRGVGAFECSARGATQLRASGDGRGLCHTNHPLVCQNAGIFDAVQRLEDPERLRRSRLNSECRLDCLQRSLDSNPAPGRAVDVAKRALRSHDGDYPVCCHNVKDRSWFTAWSVIYELADQPVAHFTCGPPCRSDYRTDGFGGRRE